MGDWNKYRRTNTAEMRPYLPSELLSNKVSISVADGEHGSPKLGDMIARNPENHDDQWLVAGDYFKKNFEPSVMGDSVDEKELYEAVMQFADAMVKKLWKKARQGYYGWNRRHYKGNLRQKLYAHVRRLRKGESQEVDIANLAMMTWYIDQGGRQSMTTAKEKERG